MVPSQINCLLRPTRRAVLASGIAGLASSGAAFGATIPLSVLAKADRLELAIYQQGEAPSEQFAKALRSRGVRTISIDHDVSALWIRDLAPLWRGRSGVVAGLTAPGALFCLERLGWDAGLRVVFRGDHIGLARGGWTHEMDMEGSSARAAALLSDAGADWGKVVADLAFTHGVPGGQKAGRGAIAPAGDDLVSWVIAPAGRSA